MIEGNREKEAFKDLISVNFYKRILMASWNRNVD